METPAMTAGSELIKYYTSGTGIPAPYAQYAPRLQEILTHMSEGASRPEIGRRLGISESTVRSHSKAIFERLGVNERAHAVAIGIRTGLIK